jgi:RNA polymerase sigma-70 factor (ECF subfamily)
LRRFGLALARDERFVLDDLAAGRLVEKLIRQSCVAPIDEARRCRLRGRIGAYARFVQLHRRHVRRLAFEESDEPFDDAPVQRDGTAVATAIRSLPLQLREALLLVALAGFSYSEAAEALDIPPDRLLERLARARERLAALMGAALDPVRESSWRGAPHLKVIK